ncbi:hypothetical protein WR25_18108 [Diploscapter pachys]|uniref:Uncharacterized protein n=1 Tax=Diploscapter pachys TaxID=2018661 RepID=A0A2A2JY87_9BILA|nr:hypothetical protein WR25_18108 [Diploscapter pachys]
MVWMALPYTVVMGGLGCGAAPLLTGRGWERLTRPVPIEPLEIRKSRQPRFAPDHPQFIGRREAIRRVQCPKVHLHFITAAREHRRAAMRAEIPVAVVRGFPADTHGLLGEHRRSAEQRTVMLAAIQAMAQPDPSRPPLGFDT